MARIRTIKPELPMDEKLGEVSREARLLFVLLLTVCDDHGRFRAAPRLLRSQLFPYDDDLIAGHVEAWLDELTSAGRVATYVVDEQTYGHLPNWSKHQRLDNAGKPLHPDPPQTAASLGGPPLDLDLDLDQEKDHDLDPAALSELWILMADREFARVGQTVKTPGPWKRKVMRNLAQEHASKATTLLADYPTLTLNELADALAGNTTILKYKPRSIASEGRG